MVTKQTPKVGGGVEMFDGSHRGTITEIQSPFCLLITWDDGKTGYVHPDDVIHLPEWTRSDCPICGRSYPH